MPTIKNQNLDLNTFLHSKTFLPNTDINKHFIATLGDTDDVKFSLNNFLNFDPIKKYFKSHVFSCINGMILDITFKFTAKFNMWFIYDCFYILKEKQWLYNTFSIMICESKFSLNIKTFYIEFSFYFIFSNLFLFIFPFPFSFSLLFFWNLNFPFLYIIINWKIQGFLFC
jgi:hypothetical protein